MNLKIWTAIFTTPSSSHFPSFSIKEHVHDTVLVTETRKHPIQPMNEVEKQTLQETQIELACNPLSNVMAIIGMCLYFSFICKSWRRRCKTRVRVLKFRKWRWQFSTPYSISSMNIHTTPRRLSRWPIHLRKLQLYIALWKMEATHMMKCSRWASEAAKFFTLALLFKLLLSLCSTTTRDRVCKRLQVYCNQWTKMKSKKLMNMWLRKYSPRKYSATISITINIQTSC